MKKLKGAGMSAVKSLLSGDIESLIGGLDDLKTITHKMSISFNKPKNAGTTSQIEILPGGRTSEKKYQELHSKFKNSSKFDMKAYAER
jgi:hypothetical protein